MPHRDGLVDRMAPLVGRGGLMERMLQGPPPYQNGPPKVPFLPFPDDLPPGEKIHKNRENGPALHWLFICCTSTPYFLRTLHGGPSWISVCNVETPQMLMESLGHHVDGCTLRHHRQPVPTLPLSAPASSRSVLLIIHRDIFIQGVWNDLKKNVLQHHRATEHTQHRSLICQTIPETCPEHDFSTFCNDTKWNMKL